MDRLEEMKKRCAPLPALLLYLTPRSDCGRNGLVAHRIAVIPGDGVGPEVIAQGVAVLERVAALYGFELHLQELPWGSAYYRRHGRMMPPDGIETLKTFDAAYFGAVGSPDLPDHVTVWGLILPIRQHLDLYVNLRPVRLFPGVPAPIRATPEEVDWVIVRENTEGEYSGLGGRYRRGEEEVAVQVDLFTRGGIARVVRYAFDLARRRRKPFVSVTKSNALPHSMTLWDQVVTEVAADYPDVPWTSMHVDAVAYRLVKEPGRFGVVVASNLFGDILSDLGAALMGSLGLAPSANLNPESGWLLCEPVHGSAPDIAGKGIANPIGAIWSGAMLLEHLGWGDAAQAILKAVQRTLEEGVHTPDLGGSATTAEVGRAVLEALEGPRVAVP